jgi:predicted Rossmann-fold nucleotide-binding protein
MERIGRYLPEQCTQIISGGAAGVDSAAECYAHEHNIAFRKILPDYEQHGRRAPIVRDTHIVQAADMVLAFWDFHSRGTSFTISECIRLDVPVRIIALNDEVER